MPWTLPAYFQLNGEIVDYNPIDVNTDPAVTEHDVIVAEHVSGTAKIHVEFSSHWVGGALGTRHYHVGVKTVGGTPGDFTYFKLHGMAV